MKKVLMILSLCFSLSLAHGQTRNAIFSAEYQTGLTTGEIRDFMKRYSFRGFSVSGEAFVNENLTVGGEVGWSGFYRKYDRQTYNLSPGSDITADLSNYLYVFPINATVGYYAFNRDAVVRPFAKLGVGAYYIERESDFGFYYIEHDDWCLGLLGEAGVYTAIAPGLGIVAKAKYNYIFYNKKDYNSLSYLNFNIGLTFNY